MSWFALLLFLLPLGLFLVIRGLRGVQIDDHPHCRRCAFDLFGLPDNHPNCPECGHDLSLLSARQMGLRRRRMIPLGYGSGLLAALVLLPTILLIANLNFQQHKPLWWLRRESQMPVTRSAALAELLRRLQSNQLSRPDIDAITDLALAEQADLNKTWLPAWGDWIETGRRQNVVDDPRWKRYAFQALQPDKLVTRSKIRRGDPLVVGMVRSPARMGASSKLHIRIKDLREYGELIASDGGGYEDGEAIISTSGGSTSWNYRCLDPKQLASAAEGVYTLHVSIDQEVAESWDKRFPALASKHFDLQAQWELVGADAETVRQIHDDSLKPAMTVKLKASNFHLDPWGHYGITVEANELPAPVAFKVIVKSGDQTWPLGNIHFARGIRSSYGFSAELKGFTADRADLILQSDLATALKTLNLTEMWVGEVVLKDVPVRRPATQPSR